MDVPAEAFRKQLLVLLPVYVNVFMMACSAGWQANAIYFFHSGIEVSATSFQCTLIVTCSEVGRMVFAIPGGILVDKFGRKNIIICTGILHFLSWITLSLNSSLITLLITRFLIGVAAAFSNATSLISIGEIASPKIRGKLVGFYQIAHMAGAFTPCAITILFSSYHILSYVTAALSCLFFIAMFWIIETPNHLINEMKLHQAKENLKSIRIGYMESDIIIEFEKLQKYIEEEKLRRKAISWLQFVRSEAIRKPLIIIILLNFFTTMTGRFTISVHTTVIYPSDGMIVPVHYYPFINQLLSLVVSLFLPFYIEKYPRRIIYMVGSGLMVLVMTFCAATKYSWMKFDDSISKWLFVAGDLLSGMIYTGSVMPMCSALKSEILPQAVKGFGGSLAVIAQTLALTISYQLYYFISTNFCLYHLFLIFSAHSLVLYVLVYFLLPEGRGKMLAEMQSNFKDKAGSFECSSNTKKDVY